MSKKFWDESFSSEEFVYGVTENEFINNMSDYIPERSTVACFAEGEGRNAVFLAGLGHNVTTYDQSVVGLEKTRTLAKENNVTVQTVEKDLTAEKVEAEQYDAAIMVFGHVPEKDQPFLMESMIGSVKKGGHIIFEVYSDDQLAYGTGGPRSIDLLYDPTSVLQYIKDQKCLHFYYGEAERHEGERHSGLCHVIQVVVEKK